MSADFGSPFGNHMYLNNGDGTFDHHFPAFANQVGSRAAVNGDYDNDGDLDLFINATQSAFKGLYRNDLNIGNGENWINLTLEGTVSNRSAIGATVRVKTTINNQEMWQRRDISTQNAFCGHNDLRVHFGLGDADNIDSLVIEWPLGLVETYTDVSSNQFLNYIEGQTSTNVETAHKNISLGLFPNPATTHTMVNYQLNDTRQKVRLQLLDTSRRLLSVLLDEQLTAGEYSLQLNTSEWTEGVYYLLLESENTSVVKPLIIVRE